ncbi:unnamed protein product [Rotaria sordida]|uniref:Uncharacterized protein n=1 Tax=Rotaria sordida TaxID=392033 RepID=A0A815T5P5_9BILA|nr:unnamed protein product [Rotaria sordida]CAF1499263.1 unnamed protein product [Rotaria sordida]
MIFYQAPHIISLDVSLQGDASHIHSLSLNSQLRRLTLKIDDSSILLTQIEQVLSKLTKLIYFELCAKGDRDLANGHQWKILSEALTTFNFNSIKNMNYFIEELLRLFPYVEHLQMSSLNSRKQIIRLIDGFKYLSSASFTVKSPYNEDERRWYFDPDLSIFGTRRLSKDNFRCRVYRLTRTNSSYNVHIWIGKQTCRKCWLTYCSPRRGYYWHRLIT